MNFCGCLDVEKLVGFGHLEFDEKSAQVGFDMLKEVIKSGPSETFGPEFIDTQLHNRLL